MSSHGTGYTFVDDSQMSVCEKINKYFAKKTTASDHNSSSDSTSDSSVDSFSHLDNSFAELLNSNPHVTLIRNSKKGKNVTAHAISDETSDNSVAGPSLSSESRTITCDDSFESSTDDWWNRVSDESFLKVEAECQSPKDTAKAIGANETLIFDVEEPSFLNDTSVLDSSTNESLFFKDMPRFGNVSILSPMKQVAMRRPSTIIEESTIRSINTSDEYSHSSSSLSLKNNLKDVSEQSVQSSKSSSRSYRSSLVNVFPTKSRIGFYDNMEKVTSSISPSKSVVSTKIYNKENSIRSVSLAGNVEQNRVKKQNILKNEDSICLIDFGDSVETDPVTKRNVPNKNDSICLISLNDSVACVSPTNNSIDQSVYDSSDTDNETPDQFNDTLEAVDYYMKQGKKILDKTMSSTSVMQPHPTSSPRNRNNSLLKQALARRHLMNINGDNK